MSFNQGAPGVPTLINSSAVLVTGNAASANALTVRQFGTGNVFSAQTTTGSTALFVGANGNVGVGTTSPAYVLDVLGSARVNTGTSNVIIGAGQGLGQGGLYMYPQSSVPGTSWNIGAGLQGGTANAITFVSGTNVGIGTTSTACTFHMYQSQAGPPATSGSSDSNIAHRIHVSSIGIDTGVYGGGYAWIQPRNATNYATNYGMTLCPNGGNVGIGTTNPGNLLHVYGGNIQLGSTGTAIVTNYVTGSDFGNLSLQSGYQGASSAPKITLVGYTGAGTVNGDNIIQLATNGSTRMTVNQSGNVGIGTASPGYLLDLCNGDIRTQNGGNVGGAGGAINFAANAGYGPMAQIKGALDTAAGSVNDQGSVVFLTRPQEVNPYTVRTNLTERMRITSAGNVGIGTNPGALLDVYGGTTRNYAVTDSTIITESTGDNFSFVQFRVNTNGTPKYTYLTLKNSGGSNQFWICANNSWTTGVYLVQNGTAWSSSSDARLKNIIEPISNALSKVEQINPCIYSLKDDEMNTRRIGVIAQDVYKVLPEAVDSTPDSEQMMGVQYSSLVPLALAAIKELSAENMALKTQMASLEQRLATLEAKLAA